MHENKCHKPQYLTAKSNGQAQVKRMKHALNVISYLIERTIRDNNGLLVTTDEDMVKEWEKYFDQLLNCK